MAQNTFRTASTRACGHRHREGLEEEGENPGRGEEVQHRREDEGEQGGSEAVPVPGRDGGVRLVGADSGSLIAARGRAGSERQQRGESGGEGGALTLWQPSPKAKSSKAAHFWDTFDTNLVFE